MEPKSLSLLIGRYFWAKTTYITLSVWALQALFVRCEPWFSEACVGLRGFELWFVRLFSFCLSWRNISNQKYSCHKSTFWHLSFISGKCDIYKHLLFYLEVAMHAPCCMKSFFVVKRGMHDMKRFSQWLPRVGQRNHLSVSFAVFWFNTPLK